MIAAAFLFGVAVGIAFLAACNAWDRQQPRPATRMDSEARLYVSRPTSSNRKPGDVAMLSLAGLGDRRAIRESDYWADYTGAIWDDAVDARPLVVIDPAALERPKRGGDDAFTTADFARMLRLIAKNDCGGRTYRAEVVLEVADLIDPQPGIRVEVFRHYVGSSDGGLKTALCGKVWRPNAEANVIVTGLCPTCFDMVPEGWSA